MSFKTIQVGMLDVNCYLVPVEKSQTLYIIDPGSEAAKIAKLAKEFDFKQAVILFTHGHVDHISGCGQLKKELDIEDVYIHKNEVDLYFSPKNNLLPWVPTATDLPQPNVDFKSNDYELIETPGHSKGGVCFYFKNIPALFSGDTLFKNSIGRTDLPGGNSELLLKSIKTKLFTLPKDLKVYPGHGESTTIREEIKNNPFAS